MTDASNNAVGAVLQQLVDLGDLSPSSQRPSNLEKLDTALLIVNYLQYI